MKDPIPAGYFQQGGAVTQSSGGKGGTPIGAPNQGEEPVKIELVDPNAAAGGKGGQQPGQAVGGGQQVAAPTDPVTGLPTSGAGQAAPVLEGIPQFGGVGFRNLPPSPQVGGGDAGSRVGFDNNSPPQNGVSAPITTPGLNDGDDQRDEYFPTPAGQSDPYFTPDANTGAADFGSFGESVGNVFGGLSGTLGGFAGAALGNAILPGLGGVIGRQLGSNLGEGLGQQQQVPAASEPPPLPSSGVDTRSDSERESEQQASEQAREETFGGGWDSGGSFI